MAKATTREEKPAIDGMFREQVAALSPVERERRRMRLLSRPGTLTVRDFAAAAGLSVNHFYRLRMDYLANGGEVTPNTTPTPDPDVNSADIRKPGDAASARGASAVWRWDTALAWLAWSGRGDEDYVPNPRGRLASGRPPRERTEPVASTPAVSFEDYLARVRAEVAAYNAAASQPSAA